jgi:NDP-sugar pyrophosphorylase family protein
MLPDAGDHERSTFPHLARRRRLAGYELPQGVYWRAIDTAKDLDEAAKELAAFRMRQGEDGRPSRETRPLFISRRGRLSVFPP